MEILQLLCLLTLSYFAVDALVRVKRASTCPRITDFSGRVKYRRKGTRAVFRCQKKFDRYGSKFATCLDDGTWSNEPPLCIKAGCVPLDPSKVTNLDMEVVNGALVKFTCLENYLLIGETQTYCNGKDWSAPLPRCAAPHELTECDFEEDLCGWTQDDNEEQDWIRNVGPTPTGNTGPKHDHTLGDAGNGHYLFFETSNPTMTGHQANLLSPVYPQDLSPMCFDFWYHILGPDEAGHVGSLEVFVLDQSQFIDDDGMQPLLVKEGNKGDKWHRGEIAIGAQVEPYQIAIVATRALSYISDIAIDDVRLFNCTQQPSPEPSTSTTQTVNTTIPLTASTAPVTTTTKTTIKPTTTPTIKTTTSVSPTTTSAKTSTLLSTTVSNTVTTTTAPPPTTMRTSLTTTQLVSTSLSPVTTKAMTSKQVLSSSTASISPSTSQKSQITSSAVTRKSTQTPSVTTLVTTATTTNTPGTSMKSSAKTTATSTKPSTTTITPTTVPSTTTSTTGKTSTTTSTTAPTTTKPPASSTTTQAVTTSVTTSTSTTESKTKPTIETSTSDTSSTPTKSTTTLKSTVKTTSLSSTRVSSSRSTATPPSTPTTVTSSIVSSTTSKISTKDSKNKTKKGNVTPATQTTKSAISKTTIKSTPSKTTKVTKPTKRTNALTTKGSIADNTTKDNSISVSDGRSQHPEDDTLKPLMIGLCVGIVAGLIIIGVIAYVCVRRRKFYTSRYEDELKPITSSASIQSLNNGHYYQDEEYESES